MSNIRPLACSRLDSIYGRIASGWDLMRIPSYILMTKTFCIVLFQKIMSDVKRCSIGDNQWQVQNLFCNYGVQKE